MDVDPHFFQMEDNLIFFQMEDNATKTIKSKNDGCAIAPDNPVAEN